MDLLNETTVKNMCEITSVAEYNSQIEISQNKEKQTVTFTNLSTNQTTVMNCACNSVSATIRQWARHLADETLFSDEDNYIISR